MKTIQAIFLIALTLVLSACEKNETDSRLSAVPALNEPADAKAITLQASASAAVYFEWEACKAADAGATLYQIAFDTQNGDFTNPVYLLYADNNGGKNSVSVTHKQLNKIAGMMGIKSSESGVLQWTVFSSKGTAVMKAAQANTLNITRLAGFDEVPIDVFVTGEASEGGTDLSRAQQMKAIANGEFEVYTQLEAGKTYHFVDGKSGTPRAFYEDDGVVKEGADLITPDKTGVYRISLDFNTGSAVYTEVKSLHLFFCTYNTDLFELPYVGNGVFKAVSQPIAFKDEGGWKDERYKFRMYVTDSSGADLIEGWGTKNGTDSRPSPTSPPSYYYMKGVPLSQWDDKWKFADEMDGALVDVTAYFQTGEYTHEVKKVN